MYYMYKIITVVRISILYCLSIKAKISELFLPHCLTV